MVFEEILSDSKLVLINAVMLPVVVILECFSLFIFSFCIFFHASIYLVTLMSYLHL